MNKQHYWFKNKIFGWGWVPISWQGWLLTLGYVLTVIAVGFLLAIILSDPRIFIWTFVPFSVLCSIYMTKLAYANGEKPHWPWE